MLAQALLGRVLLAQGKDTSAQAFISRAEERAQRSENLSLRLAVFITRARGLAQGVAADLTSALRLATAAEAAAKNAGFIPEQLEARLLLYQIEIAAGQKTGRVHLQALSREARAKGFGLIAAKAVRQSAP